jgi:hypothetical protein
MSAREEFEAYSPAWAADFAAYQKARLALAGRIAGGMSANPAACEGYDWKGEIARASWEIAGKLMRLSESGGC